MTTTFNDLPLDIQRIIYGMKYKMEKYDKWIEKLMTCIRMLEEVAIWLAEHPQYTMDDLEGYEEDVGMWLGRYEKILSTIPDLTNKKYKQLWKEVERVAPEGCLEQYGFPYGLNNSLRESI